MQAPTRAPPGTPSPAPPSPARSGAGATSTRSRSSSREAGCGDRAPGAAAVLLGSDEGDAPPLGADRGQGEDGGERPAQSLVARRPLPGRPRADDAPPAR